MWLEMFDDGVKCSRKRLKEPIKLMGFSGNRQKIREEAVVQLEFTTSEWRLQLANVECVVSSSNLPGRIRQLILNCDVMSRKGFYPRRHVAEAHRQSPVFDLQSDGFNNPEKTLLEVTLSADIETLGEAVSAEMKDERQDYLLHYTTILEIQDQND